MQHNYPNHVSVLFRTMIASYFIVLIFQLSVIVSDAYALNTVHLSSKTASYQWGNNLQISGSSLRTAWETAINDWANTATTNFYYTPYSENNLNTIHEEDSCLYGRIYYLETSGSILLSFSANLNASNTTLATNSTVARSTANHEFGHALGLDDLSSGTSIMNSNRDRTQIFIPRYDDQLGVQAIYDAVQVSE